MKNILRLPSLDILRGILAVSIMFYHLSIWLFKQPDSSSLLGRLGIYGVSVFFVLSGLSMAMVYHSYFYSLRNGVVFYVRRIFRIFPLFWLAVFSVLVFQFFKLGYIKYDIEVIIANLSCYLVLQIPVLLREDGR